MPRTDESASLPIDINDIVRLLVTRWRSLCTVTRRRWCRTLRGCAPGVGIRSLTHLHQLILQVLGHLLQQLAVRLRLCHLLLQGRQLRVDGCFQIGRHLVPQVLQLLLSLVDEGLRIVLGLNNVLALLVICRVCLRVSNHPVDIGLVEGR
mmetsp:Transcript_10551/g.28217  ORF Transcript_10551/g.28217 Transcript_10551/m.28217 type:complete len:150 (-) Transcript_10551:214-663(-)